MAKAWKELEKRVANILGGKRASRPWADAPDVVVGDWLIVECKQRAILPQWIKDAVAQARRYAKPTQLAVAALHEKGTHTENSLVVMTLRDFKEWFGDDPALELEHD